MNKFLLTIAVVAVVAVALGTAGFVYAQSTTPVPGTGYGYSMGMGGGRGARGGMMMGQGSIPGDQDGLLHDEMINAYAQKMGVTVDELNTRLAKGETMAQIASSKGLTVEQFRTLMTDARSQAIDQAVKSGTLTQAQADWMKQRGAGIANGGRGMGQGRNANQDCPYYPQTQQ